MSTVTVNYTRISDWLLQKYEIKQSAKDLKDATTAFLRDPIDTKRLNALDCTLRISLYKKPLFLQMNVLYPRLQRFTKLSKSKLSEKLFTTVISHIKPFIMKEVEEGAKIWAASSLEFRSTVINDVFLFFVEQNYNPTEESLTKLTQKLTGRMIQYWTNKTSPLSISPHHKQLKQQAMEKAMHAFIDSIIK